MKRIDERKRVNGEWNVPSFLVDLPTGTEECSLDLSFKVRRAPPSIVLLHVVVIYFVAHFPRQLQEWEDSGLQLRFHLLKFLGTQPFNVLFVAITGAVGLQATL